MVEISYSVIPRTQHRFDVEMAKPGGTRKMIEGFGSEHEANAWIVQAQRMIRAAGPWTPLRPRDATGKVPPPDLPPLLSEEQRLHEERGRSAARRASARAARERGVAKT